MNGIEEYIIREITQKGGGRDNQEERGGSEMGEKLQGRERSSRF